jgi:hypothetical protein
MGPVGGGGVSEWTHTVVGGPWHERIGLRARIVPPPPGERHYPFDSLAPGAWVVLIEDDPLNGPGTKYEPAQYPQRVD